MADGWASGGAGVATVGDDGSAGAQLWMVVQRLGSPEHFGHAASPWADVANHHGIARYDFAGFDGLYSVLLIVEHSGTASKDVGSRVGRRMFDDSAARRDVSVEGRHTAVRLAGICQRADDVPRLVAKVFQIAGSMSEKAGALKLREVFPDGFACDSHLVQVKEVRNLPHDGGHAACKVQIRGRPFSAGDQ